MLCGKRCRQRLCAIDMHVTQSSARRALAQPKYRQSFLFSRPFYYRKRKRNESADFFVGRKIKRRKIKNAFSGAENIKRKRNSVGLYVNDNVEFHQQKPRVYTV